MSVETLTHRVDEKNDAPATCTVQGTVTYARGPAPISTVTIEGLIATTDIRGAYEFNYLKPGKYEVNVSPPKGWNYKGIRQTIELEAGQVKVVDFYLEKVIRETILEGYVWDGNGTPAKGAVLSGVLCGNDIKSTTADEHGYFIFKNVTAGNRFIRVNLAGHIGETRDLSIPEQQKISIEFHLKKAAHKLYGSVTNEVGKTVPASLQLFKNSIVVEKIETSAENGNFAFPVEDGEYALFAQTLNYEQAAWSGTISEDTKINLKLSNV
jgi:hypothetical protein